jgi:hypothetical protein
MYVFIEKFAIINYHIAILGLFLRNSFHTSKFTLLDQKWRDEKGLPANPNAEGPLTNLPDYTFMDGRPTPLGVIAFIFTYLNKLILNCLNEIFSNDRSSESSNNEILPKK